MKRIKLTRGQVALVDDRDFKSLGKHKWCAAQRRKNFIAVQRSTKRKGDRIILMHRRILRAKAGQQVDHKNGNTLDNRRKNIRICTNAQNGFNRGPRCDNKLGVKGVSFDKSRGKFSAELGVHGKRIRLGRFETLLAAKRAYIKAAKRHHGAFAKWK